MEQIEGKIREKKERRAEGLHCEASICILSLSALRFLHPSSPTTQEAKQRGGQSSSSESLSRWSFCLPLFFSSLLQPLLTLPLSPLSHRAPTRRRSGILWLISRNYPPTLDFWFLSVLFFAFLFFTQAPTTAEGTNSPRINLPGDFRQNNC